ncbi:MAG: hypothetical protein M1812_003935 [Candelaria pacifica]|nr:MAG: hypothetical protein M1812_003935 [Candelaria pacifica]
MALLLTKVPLTSALQTPTKSEDLTSSSSTTDRGHDANLKALMGSTNPHQPAIYAHAMQILTILESSPSCHRLATVTLLTSCQTLEGSTGNTNLSPETSEAIQDEIKSIYAARLAVCELMGASAAVPLQCSPLIPSQPVKAKNWFGTQSNRQSKESPPKLRYDDLNARQLGQCLTSLESRPQWWTSYSNARQNAVVMCQAARSEIDKDELLELHKAMAGVTSDLSEAMSKAVLESRIHIEDQEAFTQAVKEFQTRLLRDLDNTSSEAKTYLSRLMGDVDMAIQAILRSISSTGKAAEASLDVLHLNIITSNDDVNDVRKNVAKVFQQVVKGGSELAASQSKDWDLNHSKALEVQQALEIIRVRDVQELLNAFGMIHKDLRASNELMALMHQRQGSLDERLLNLDKAFEGLEARVETFQTAQTMQVETQSRLQESFRAEMTIAHGLIDQVSTSAANLHSTLEEAATKVQNIGVLNGMGSAISRWGWLFVFLVGTAMVSRKAAGCMAIGIGATCAAVASGLPERLAHIHSTMILARPTVLTDVPNLISLIKVFAVGILIIFLLYGIYHFNQRRSSRYQYQLCERLPNTEKEERDLDHSVWFF